MFDRIMELPDEVRDKYSGRSLRFAAASGSRMRPDVVIKFMDQFGDVIYNNYNATEAGMIATATPEEIREMGVAEEREYTMEEIEEALCIVRSFDPPGIACVDLRESLLLQMDIKGIAHEIWHGGDASPARGFGVCGS